MKYSFARKNKPVSYMICEQCGGESGEVNFATNAHKICLSCEAETPRTCNNCEKDKPLTAFSLNIGATGSRKRTCKDCIVESRRKKYAIGARCAECGTKIKGEARGVKRYCEACPKPPRKKTPKAIYANPISDFLKMRWRPA